MVRDPWGVAIGKSILFLMRIIINTIYKVIRQVFGRTGGGHQKFFRNCSEISFCE